MADRMRVLGLASKIAYVAVWLAMLIFVEVFYDSTETSDSAELRAILFAILSLLALPISLIVLGMLMVAAMFAPMLDASILDAFNNSVLVSSEWFRLQFFLWWLLMFAASYWQWFRLFPWIFVVVRRWISRDRALPPGATPA